MHYLRQRWQAAKTKLDWEVVALSALSIALGLRISEAAAAAPGEAELRFRGTKGRSGLHRPKMGPWARKWGDFLARFRAISGHHPHRPAFFTSKAHLAAAFLELVHSPGCTCKTIRWHSWRRFGTAQLQALGLPLHLVQIWGGWKSPAVARMYTTPGAVPQVTGRTGCEELGGPVKRAQLQNLPSWGPTSGRNCYVTHVFLGSPEEGTKSEVVTSPCLLGCPKKGGIVTQPLRSRGSPQ